MARTRTYLSHECEWSSVSARKPCPVCAGVDACHWEVDGSFARCARNPSDWPIVGGGWLHRIEEQLASAAVASAEAGARTRELQ